MTDQENQENESILDRLEQYFGDAWFAVIHDIVEKELDEGQKISNQAMIHFYNFIKDTIKSDFLGVRTKDDLLYALYDEIGWMKRNGTLGTLTENNQDNQDNQDTES